MSTTLDVLAYIIYIIKEIAECIQQGVGLCYILCSVRIGDDMQTQMLDADVNVSTCHDGIAIVMNGTRR